LAKNGDITYTVAGNSPFLVGNKTGNIIKFGTSESDDYYIAKYEAGRSPVK